MLSESWSPAHDALTVEVAGAQGREYEIGMWNPAQVSSVEGAEPTPTKANAENAKIKVAIPANTSEPYPRKKIVIHFIGKSGTHP